MLLMLYPALYLAGTQPLVLCVWLFPFAPFCTYCPWLMGIVGGNNLYGMRTSRWQEPLWCNSPSCAPPGIPLRVDFSRNHIFPKFLPPPCPASFIPLQVSPEKIPSINFNTSECLFQALLLGNQIIFLILILQLSYWRHGSVKTLV